jgi:hypothetical protein
VWPDEASPKRIAFETSQFNCGDSHGFACAAARETLEKQKWDSAIP